MRIIFCYVFALTLLAITPAAMAEDSVFLRIDHAGPISWERIKVFDDKIYFYQRALAKLTRFDSQGRALSEHRLDAEEFQSLLPAVDFTVGSQGQVFLTGRTRSGGTYLLALSASGESEQVELNTRLEVRKVAVLPDDAPVILGWDEGALEAVKALSQPRRVSPIKASLPKQPIPILQRCDPGSGTSREIAYLPLAPNPKLAGQIAWSLYVTPFTTDLRGNIYFSTADGHLHIQPSRGSQWAEKLPPTTEELQIVQNILAHPEGYVLVEVNEGSNLASEEEKAEGGMMMLSPNVRVFSYDGLGFEEIYSGREIQNLVGVFSDGSWVNAIKKRTSIDLARFEPPLRQ